MGPIQGANRHAGILFPERLDDDMAEDKPVRCLDAVADELDLDACGFRRAVPAVPGRPGDAPGDLVTLDRYGSLYRLRSRRRLEQEAPRHVDVRWRLKKRRPDHTTMAHFRKHNLQPLRQVCRTFTRLGKKLALFGAELVALEGSTFRAGHAQARHFTKDQLPKLLRQRDEGLAAYLRARECSAAPDERGTAGGAHANALAAQIAALTPRPRREESGQAPRRSRDQAPRSRTAPARRAMPRGKGRGTAVCSTVPTAVDAQPKLMVACEVTNDAGARAGLRPMALQAQAGLGCRVDAAAAVGDYQGPAGKAWLEAGLTPSGPRPITAAHETLGLCSNAECTDDSAPETSQWPAGQVRTVRVDPVALGRPLRDEASAAGNGCALKPPCTRRKDGRRITRGVDEPLLEEREPRVRSRPEVMTRRQELVEHPCGAMTRGWDHGDLLRRGLEKVRTACSLPVLTSHRRRVLNRVERPRLRAALG